MNTHTHTHTHIHTYIHIYIFEDLILGGDACLLFVRNLPQFDSLIVRGEDLPNKKISEVSIQRLCRAI